MWSWPTTWEKVLGRHFRYRAWYMGCAASFGWNGPRRPRNPRGATEKKTGCQNGSIHAVFGIAPGLAHGYTDETVAHKAIRLMLLGSPPDMIHRPQSYRACRSLNCTLFDFLQFWTKLFISLFVKRNILYKWTPLQDKLIVQSALQRAYYTITD